MITLQDCIDLCGLTEAEVLAIAEHEHVPEVIAAALAGVLLRQRGGPERVRQMIIDDIRDANARGDARHAHQLLCCLKCYLEAHPDAWPLKASG
jgi:hypothetical protein